MANPIQGLKITSNIKEVKQEFENLIRYVNISLTTPFTLRLDMQDIRSQINDIGKEITKNVNQSYVKKDNLSNLTQEQQNIEKIVTGTHETIAEKQRRINKKSAYDYEQVWLQGLKKKEKLELETNNKIKESQKEITKNVNETSNSIKKSGQDSLDALGKFAKWYVVGGIFMQLLHTLGDSTKYIIEMDSAMTDLNKVVDLTSKQMMYAKENAVLLGKELGKSSIDIMQGMAEFGRATKDLNDIIELTRVASMASNVTSLTVAESSKALSTAMVTYKINAKDSIQILDQWNEIQNNFRRICGSKISFN